MVTPSMSQDRLDPKRLEALRSIPSMDALLRTDGLADLSRPVLLREARAWLDECRDHVLQGRWTRADSTM